ncbi:transcriptional regulator [Vandammella animalimorsus]|uniref:Transcriptional regulator n=1 Tax=Vandammella animalimorsus TaxID=2029117 RepID=A0A2A2T4L0_9BURK|nr:PaaX family transcriptional regulator C-terminal domain-containing protein [Vandammella animalimorsus]PAT31909.1 transcriptional regulator [Vandammella animalimorsus]PAX16444.1 transcriptional regulator [Vandammella animalimorsus]PAX18859.1 transcriptional regulator [Vandammella animalimorsus]
MKHPIALDEFIAGRAHEAHEQPTHYRLVMTFFGIYGRPAGSAIPIAAAVRMLAELDCEPSSIRSSISRMKKKGVLVSKSTPAGNGYALSDGLEPHMRAGDARIFSSRPMGVGDPWLLVSFSVPESERQYRHKIRIGLARLGFGSVGAALYIGPARLREETIEYIREHGLWDYVEMFTCQPCGLGDLQAKVARWWNLQALGKEYQSFVKPYQAELERWQKRMRQGQFSAQDAFKSYLPMVTCWRRLPYLDPGLPLELLPANWIGITARRVFNDLHRLLAPLSQQYYEQVMAEYLGDMDAGMQA